MARLFKRLAAGVTAAVEAVKSFDDHGRELNDPRPMEIPAGFRRPETLQEQMRRLIRTDVSQWAEEQGAESFDEANDFDTEEDDAELRATHHELHEEVIDEAKRVRREEAEAAAARQRGNTVPETEGEEHEEGVETEAARPAARANLSRRSVDKEAPSPQRRRPRRREEADTTSADSED